MAFWKRKSTAQPDESATHEPAAESDPKLPGSAGYAGVGLRKNAMPEQRFNFVRPDDRQD